MKKLVKVLTTTFVSDLSFSQERVLPETHLFRFFLKSAVENFEAHNKNAVTVLDKTTGQVEFSVLMKGFEFEKAGTL